MQSFPDTPFDRVARHEAAWAYVLALNLPPNTPLTPIHEPPTEPGYTLRYNDAQQRWMYLLASKYLPQPSSSIPPLPNYTQYPSQTLSTVAITLRAQATLSRLPPIAQKKS